MERRRQADVPDSRCQETGSPNGGLTVTAAYEEELAAEAVTLSFATLPIELLPQILQHLSWRIRDLASCARVNSVWQVYAQVLLYERIVLRNSNILIKVFRSLAAHPKNAAHARIVEIRAFPLGLLAEALEQIEIDIVIALRNAKNLRELVWTRTGSLSDRVIVELFPHLHSLQKLQITGDTRTFDPALLVKSLKRPPPQSCCRAIEDPPRSGRFRKEASPYDTVGDSAQNRPTEAEPNAGERCIERFSVNLPDKKMASKLPDVAEQLGGKLRGLNILSYHSSHVTDAVLQAAALHLPNLTHLSIVGCKAVSIRGVLPVLQAARGLLEELALESLSLLPDDLHLISPSLGRLRVLSLTYPKARIPAASFLASLSDLVSQLEQLQSFTFYAPGGSKAITGADEEPESDDEAGNNGSVSGARPDGYQHTSTTHHRADGCYSHGIPMSGPALSTAFLQRLMITRGKQLRMLRLHGIGMSLDQLSFICDACSNENDGQLVDLVVHLYEHDARAMRLCAALRRLGRLKDLHVLSSANSDMLLTEADLQNMADASPTTLRQIGFRHHVWMIDRSNYDRVRKKGCQLQRWDNGSGAFFRPEALFAVRT
ncbi:hypothetical protein K437DRAFT_256960 [Tilletiaria anomala UBC 951]|uniref:F-box domain-containing protein n=1 Tax=Tilletiaria anomala (strain ATCC 24038 / CBS 436.72 / UBC 951) TaxID=1037660 RepID=A0A066VTB7_TILAU|nr:uncharacterized protein K437DRAFT_256960 [Tilletiaria anomala UBC 951]KDN44716.1 hypothetical protein K437DRAFT_256960 [Tilletiaria anomala UBC 951]